MIDYENRPGQYRGLIEVYLGTLRRIDRKDEWFWRAKGKNGQIVADGSEGYLKRQGCVNAVERLLGAQLTGKGLEQKSMAQVMRESAGEVHPTPSPTICDVVIPWRLIVFNRDGSVNREGALY